MRHWIAGLLALTATWASAVEPVEQFTAEQVMNMAGRQITSRVYVDNGNIRQELQLPGGPPTVSIFSAEKRVVWTLLPGNMYLEHAMADDKDVSRMAWTSREFRELLGQETVNGQPCDKYRLKSDQELLYYVNRETGLPVMMKGMNGRLQVEWRNAQKGPQPAALFQLPPGLRRMTMPSIPGLPLPVQQQ